MKKIKNKMKKIFLSSVGSKLVVSLSGLFLLIFLLVHLTLNLLLFYGADVYNSAAHFMDENVLMKILQPVLAVGFIVHIVYTNVLTFRSMRARPVGYKVKNRDYSSTWVSRNMIISGAVIFLLLILHLRDFFYEAKFGDLPIITNNGKEMEDMYSIVTATFGMIEYVVIYLIWIILLGLHLMHAFWSAFQTIGLSNKIWEKRLKLIGLVYALIVTVGFAIIPIYFYLVSRV